MNGERSSEWVQPVWWGPPERWIGGALPLPPLLARSELGAILIEDVKVYPTGISFRFRALSRQVPRVRPEQVGGGEPEEAAGLVYEDPSTGDVEQQKGRSVGHPCGRRRTDGVRFGFEFEDGRRASTGAPVGGPGDFTILGFQEGEPIEPDPIANAVLSVAGGASAPDFMRRDGFLWPLPPGGLVVFGSWPEASIPEDSIRIEARAVSEALARARRM